jgi:hypothetical protein
LEKSTWNLCLFVAQNNCILPDTGVELNAPAGSFHEVIGFLISEKFLSISDESLAAKI